MKKILIVIVCIASHYLNAQNIVTMTGNTNFNAGDYIKDTEGYLNKFIGTWKYTNGNEVLTIKIVKVDKVESWGIYSDELFGGYKYVKDGIVKVDNLNFTTTLPTVHDYNAYQHYADMQGSSLLNNFQAVKLVGGDRIGGRYVDFLLEIVPNTNEGQMKLKMLPKEYHRFLNTDPVQGTGAGLPNNITLIKQ